MNKTMEYDAREMVLEGYQEEEEPLYNKLDEMFKQKVGKYYSEKKIPKEFYELQYRIYTKFLDEYLKSPYFLAQSGTGELQNYLGVKYLFKDKIIKLDEKLREYSENVVGLPDNWNEEGSKAITIESWNHTTVLLRKILYDLWHNGFDISIPLVLPNTDGNFDIDWETEEFHLLLTVPANIKELVHIYGEKPGYSELEIEVRINYELVDGVIIEWLKKIL